MVGTAGLLIVLTLAGAPGHVLCIAWCDAGWPVAPTPTCHHGSAADRTPAVAGIDECDEIPATVLFVRENLPQPGAGAASAHPVSSLRCQVSDMGMRVALDSQTVAHAVPPALSSVQLRL
ncbi:MAG: hypothetical protein A3H29_01445 [Acidobacteria bacterium RIFCSPLOWO2_02_FULL_67_21]|nr:MAG: hypothetical protein A3H29_01445 [Acidobacteria bacterium RIFCSPLOWO2_02_FULL_67_21]